MLAQGDPRAAVDDLPCDVRPVLDALRVEPVVVLAHGDIQRTVDPRAGHVALHLAPVPPLCLIHALALQFVEALFVVRLELGDMPALRRLRHAALDNSVHAAADVRRQIDVRLLPVGVGVMDLHADLAQPADDCSLFAMPPLKETEHPPVELLTHCPPEREPQIPLTGMTEE